MDNLTQADLAVLDKISAPMTVRDIDRALGPYLTRTQRNAVHKALRGVTIVAIVAGPDARNKAG